MHPWVSHMLCNSCSPTCSSATWPLQSVLRDATVKTLATLVAVAFRSLFLSLLSDGRYFRGLATYFITLHRTESYQISRLKYRTITIQYLFLKSVLLMLHVAFTYFQTQRCVRSSSRKTLCVFRRRLKHASSGSVWRPASNRNPPSILWSQGMVRQEGYRYTIKAHISISNFPLKKSQGRFI